MAAFWICVAVLVAGLMLIGKLQDRRRNGAGERRRGRGTSESDRRLKEYRRQAIAENDFIVPSGMTHEVRNNGQRRRPHGG